MQKFLAGTAGFEPANAGTKTQCLTTWRRPNIARTMIIITRQPEKIHEKPSNPKP